MWTGLVCAIEERGRFFVHTICILFLFSRALLGLEHALFEIQQSFIV